MTKKEIEQIYKEFHVPPNIIAHMKVVAYICEQLSDNLRSKGFKIKKNLVIKAALLHDVFRVCDIKNFDPKQLDPDHTKNDLNFWIKFRKKYQGKEHEEEMANWLIKRGEKSIGNLVHKHGFLQINNLKNWEEKILYYADKRVNFDKIVPLKKRFAEGQKRNSKPGDNEQLIKNTLKEIQKLEREFESVLQKTLNNF